MNDLKLKDDTNDSSKYSVVRLSPETSKLLSEQVARANKKEVGRRIRQEDLIAFCLTLMERHHIREIQERSMSNADRMELLYRSYASKKKGLTKDEFLGLLLSGKIGNVAADCSSKASATLSEPERSFS